MDIHFSLIHSVVNRHLNCFYFLAIMNNAPVNMYASFICEYIFSFLENNLSLGCYNKYHGPSGL